MMTSLLLAATFAAPLSWQQIELDQNLLLNASMKLNEKVAFASGTAMKVTDILPLDEINVISYKMQITPCKAAIKNQTSEMTMVNEIYGAQLEKNCVLDIFLETKDFSQPSLFNAQ